MAKVEEIVVELTLVLEAETEAELELVLLDELGFVVEGCAINTILGIVVCTIKVAVIVLCVFGNAFSLPLHIDKALETTASILLLVP